MPVKIHGSGSNGSMGGFPDGWNEVVTANAYEAISAGSPITMFAFGGIDKGVEELPTPAVLPPDLTLYSDVSPEESHIVITFQGGAPTFYQYRIDDNILTKTATPAQTPSAVGSGCAYSPDGKFLIVCAGRDDNSVIFIYRREGDSLISITHSITGLKNVSSCQFSHDSRYLLLCHTSSPYMSVYKIEGETFTKLANPATLPSGEGRRCKFSKDSKQILMASADASPLLSIYSLENDVLTKLATNKITPIPSASYNILSIDWTDTYIACCVQTSPFLYLYKKVDDVYTRITDYTNVLTVYALNCCITPNERFLLITNRTAPYFLAYELADTPAVVPVRGVSVDSESRNYCFSKTGNYWVASSGLPPYIRVFDCREKEVAYNTATAPILDVGSFLGVALETKNKDAPIKVNLFTELNS